jgi:bacterioferritin
MAAADRTTPHYFLHDILMLRDAAVAMMRIAVASREASVLYLLQTLLTAEIVCLLRYGALATSPLCLAYERLRYEFEGKARDERRHMGLLAGRIEALGGVPDFAPEGLASRSAAVLAVEHSLLDILSHNLVAERAMIKLYHAARHYLLRWDEESAAMLYLLLEDETRRGAGIREMLLPPGLPVRPVMH